MPTPLPSEPSLVQLRKQARELQRRLQSGDTNAMRLLAEHFPGGPTGAGDTGRLYVAQLVLAREYGFASWARLVAHLEVVEKYSGTPDLQDPSTLPPADAFLVQAVLRYGQDDGPEHWAAAREILSTDPRIGPSDIHTASATADHGAVQRFLQSDRRLAVDRGGPLGWEPLLYLAYARHDLDVALADVLTTAGLLLQAGADPNAGYLWHGLTTPFTVLTGLFGSGELGSHHQPAHPHAVPLARLLLEAGADPNDGQTLYNRMFEPDNTHLELLFDYGLGREDGGPWHRRLPETTASPTEMVRTQLSWAVSHGMPERVRLLATHGADLDSPSGPDDRIAGPRTPTALALISGHPEIAALLRELGASDTGGPADRLVAALLTGDARQAQALTDASPGLLASVRRSHPSLILRAAAAGSLDGVELLLANGFDVNAMGRQDIPVEQKWETALHHAAGEGDLVLARALLAAGADPDVLDRRFRVTPLGWAEHFGKLEMVELLRPVTGRPGRAAGPAAQLDVDDDPAN